MGSGQSPGCSVDTPSHFRLMLSPILREADEASISSSDVQLVSRNPVSTSGKEEAAEVTNQRLAQASR